MLFCYQSINIVDLIHNFLDLENKLLDPILRVFSLELPFYETMDDYLDFIIPLIRPWSEDLNETEYYIEKPWMEVRDQEDFQEAVLHFYNEEGEYLISIDGNVYPGTWQAIEKNNKLILTRPIEGAAQRELFDLAFVNDDFFILRKHGDQQRKGYKKYFLMGRENLVSGLEWRDVMELLFNRYRSNSIIILMVVGFLILAALVAVFSFM